MELFSWRLYIVYCIVNAYCLLRNLSYNLIPVYSRYVQIPIQTFSFLFWNTPDIFFLTLPCPVAPRHVPSFPGFYKNPFGIAEFNHALVSMDVKIALVTTHHRHLKVLESNTMRRKEGLISLRDDKQQEKK